MSTPERDDVSGRLPPQDLDAEQSVLGAMLLSEAAVSEATEVLKPEDFYRGGHGEIFAAMVDLYQSSEPIDQVSVCDRLDQRGSLDQVGGRPSVFALAEAVPVVTNARRYAEIVKEMALLRGLIRVGSEVAQLGYDRPGDTRELLDMAEQKVYEIAQNGTTEDFTLIKQPLDEAFHRLTLLFEQGDGSGVTGLPTGFGELDRLTSGLQKSNLVILAARPSMGKTSLALNMAEHVAVTLQKPVALFSLEMSKAELAQRLLCSVGKVDQSRLKQGQLEDGDWMRVTGAMETLGGAPLYIDDSGAMTVMEMRAKARRLSARQPGGLALVVVDYIQLMQASVQTDNRVQEISQISRSLKMLARDLDVPVVALSQLSRAVEQRQDKRPVLSDLRESGAIEQDADVVMFIYRDAYYRRSEGEEVRPDDPSNDLSELHVAKHRNGPVGTINLRFQSRYTRFVDDYASARA
ncbi:MAG: replicative helicase [Gaiellales bacterium]|nr:replicative helicase [Gaiellales bacterium]MDX6619544.1 replicative helicase [Gaiellales bacterium]